MQKLEIPQTERIGLIKIFRENIEAIIEICKKDCEEVKITADEFKIDANSDFDEMNRDKLSQLRIEAIKPSITVNLAWDDSTIWIGDSENNLLQGMKQNIKNELKKHTRIGRYFLWMDSHWFSLFWGSLLGTGITLLLNKHSALRMSSPLIERLNNFNFPEILTSLAVTLLILSFVISIVIAIRGYAEIYLLRSRQLPGYLKRNKDNISTGVIVSILISLFWWIIGYLK